jgi:hypothetical protein
MIYKVACLHKYYETTMEIIHTNIKIVVRIMINILDYNE